MDEQQFDRIVSQLGAGMNRRHVGRFFAVLGLGVGLGAAPEAKTRRKRKKKKKPPMCTPICAGRSCGDPDGCGGVCNDGACPGTQICDDGVCRDACPGAQKLCRGGCTVLNTIIDCGDCDVACPTHASCAGGRCLCDGGFKACGDMCVPDPECCSNDVPGCPENRTCCIEGGHGVCRNTGVDEANCGGCGAAYACDGDQACIDGACQPICAPGCSVGRTCLEDPRSGDGTCTCTTHEECRAERNPGGSVCLYANGHSGSKICRCSATTWYGDAEPEEVAPCAPGEPCSNCCTNQYCRDVLAQKPGSTSYVCAHAPADSYWPRYCCKPNWEVCIGWSECCSGDCLQAGYDESTGAPEYRCLCTPPGSSCATDLECCRGKCEVTTDAFGTTTGTCRCFPIEHECKENAECCSEYCDVTTDKCACQREPCDCKLPMARCQDDSECCRGVCKDSKLCA